jgi:hypothetical protein
MLLAHTDWVGASDRRAALASTNAIAAREFTDIYAWPRGTAMLVGR